MKKIKKQKIETMITKIFLSAFLIMLASLGGKLLTWKKFGNLLQKNTNYLVTFAGGVFLVLTYHLLEEIFHSSQNIFLSLGYIIAGVIIIKIITHFIPGKHHHHSVPSNCKPKHSDLDARRVMISDTFHNAGDGILLATSYLISPQIGLGASLGILLHEVVQEISEFFIYQEAGWSVKKSLFFNFLSSASILIGIGLALISAKFEVLASLLTGIATGGFLYVLFKDLIPHSLNDARQHSTHQKHFLIFLLGALLMFSTSKILPHFHPHKHQNNNHPHQQKIINNHQHL